jgi:pyruvate/2-oxoglutarate dehydrogenase complex dihydrolipoamide dehydrogenase (E3) component
MNKKKTVAVIGGGSAGFTAARKAAALGARVLFFMGNRADRASLCVNYGCMPSKALFGPIDAMHHARRHGWLRVEPVRPEAYLGQIVAWKDREIARFRAYRQDAIRQKDSDDFLVIRTDARFVDANTLEAGGNRHRADAIIIATGSETVYPAIVGLDGLRGEVWTNEEILANTELPESLTIVGSGAIGIEFSLRYARLGCAVTLLARSRPLSGFPPQFGERLARIYELEGVRVLCGARPVALRRNTDGWFVLTTEGTDGVEPIVSRRVLVAAGRRPALSGLGLDAAGIDTDEHGNLQIDEGLRVEGRPHIFVAGDAGGKRLVVHHAHIEAGIAAENAVTEGDRKWSRRANLQVVFSDPEFGFAGLDPQRAGEAGHRVVAAAKESRLTGKLHLAGDDHGFGEMYADADDYRILGAGLLCKNADDLIHLPAYMIEHQHTIHQAARCEFYHPTKAEIVSGIVDRLCNDLSGDPFCRACE